MKGKIKFKKKKKKYLPGRGPVQPAVGDPALAGPDDPQRSLPVTTILWKCMRCFFKNDVEMCIPQAVDPFRYVSGLCFGSPQEGLGGGKARFSCP